MKIYQGVVEDISDPLKLSRVRVRVFGLHSDDKTLIPTESLPWATVAFPTTSAAISGIGTFPSGLLNGTWVYVFFTDPDEQYPVVFASLPGKTIDPTQPTPNNLEKSPNQSIADQNVVTDQDGNPVTDSSGNTIKREDVRAESPSNIGEIDPSKLGSISRQYESNGNPGAINNYKSGKDAGGASYGMYQLASYLKAAPDVKSSSKVTDKQVRLSSINQYLQTSTYANEFDGLKPATDEFDTKWKDIAKRDREGFSKDQHKFIERTHYQPAINKLPIELTNRKLAIHEMIWSMSVQLGPDKAVNKIKTVIGVPSAGVTDQVIIKRIYDSRIATVDTDFQSSSADTRRNLIDRFKKESRDLIALADTHSTGSSNQEVKEIIEQTPVYNEDGVHTEETKKTVPIEESDTQNTKQKKGFGDPNSVYPNKPNEIDTNRLSVGVIGDTIIKRKRNSIISGAVAGKVTISEPPTQYNGLYPYNHVTETQSGHVIEYDDTPKHERIHFYHRSGTFIEFHPNGNLVSKIVGKDTTISVGDLNTIAVSSHNTYIGEDKNESTAGNSTITVSGRSIYAADDVLELISNEKIKLNAPTIEINSVGTSISNLKFAKPASSLQISKAVIGEQSTPVKQTATFLSDQVKTANATDDYIAEQARGKDNAYNNPEAAKDGVKGNYPGTPEDNEIESRPSLKSNSEKSDIIQFLTGILREANNNQWRETGQGGKPSNPNITGIWKNLGYPINKPWTSDQTPWCMGFINFVLKQCGYKYVQTATANAITKSPGKWNAVKIKNSEAQPGDIAYWNYGHVNFVYSANGDKYSFVGGNQSPANSSNPDDGDVTINYKSGTSANNKNWSSTWRIES